MPCMISILPPPTSKCGNAIKKLLYLSSREYKTGILFFKNTSCY